MTFLHQNFDQRKPITGGADMHRTVADAFARFGNTKAMRGSPQHK